MKLLLVVFLILPTHGWAQFISYDDNGNPIDPNTMTEESPIEPADTDLDGSSEMAGQIVDTEANQAQTEAGALRSFQRRSDNAQTVSQVGQLAGVMFAMACKGSFGINSVSCWAAGIAFAGSVAASSHSRKMNRKAAALASGAGQSTALLDDQLNQIDQEIASAQAQVATLKEQGYIVNENGTVTGPNGVSLSGDDLNSASGLAKAGVAPEDANSVLAKIAQIKRNAESASKDKLKANATAGAKKGQALSGGDSGGAGGGSGVSLLDPEAVGGPQAAEGNGGGKRLTASEANRYKRNFLGTPIGIAGANVFGIVTRKYKKGAKKNTFFKREY